MKIISNIAYSNDKKNKTRSILIMIAICLSTMLLTMISTIGNGIIRLQRDNAAETYGSNYGIFLSVNEKQLQELKRHSEIDRIGIMCTAGVLKGNEKGSFVSADDTVIDMLPFNQEYNLEEGSYPKGAKEIAAGKTFFQSQGYSNVQIGDTVTLNYRSGMQTEYEPQEFVVSGILFDREEYTIDSSYVVFCSSEFYNSQFAENEQTYNVYFTLSDTVDVSMNNIDSVLGELADSCEIDKKNMIVNDYYLS